MVEKLPFLPDEHHYAIAAVATRASQLEHTIELAVESALLLTPKTAEFVLKNLGADRVVSLFDAVYADAMPDLVPGISELVAEIHAARGERNEIMHWIWGKSDQPETAIHASMRPFREVTKKTKTAAQIQAVADRLMRCVGGVHWYEETLRVRRGRSWLGTPSPPLPQPSFPSPLKPDQKQKRQGPPRQRRRPQA